jgi:hypothetical protein
MKEDDLEETVRLVSVSMNVEEAAWARMSGEMTEKSAA